MGDDIRINASSDQLVAAVNKAINAWKDYIKIEDAVVTAAIKFTKEGEKQLLVTAKQADGQRKLNIVMADSAKGYRTVSASITEATAKSSAYAASLRRLAAIQRDFNSQAQAAGKFVQRGVAFGGADLQAVQRYKNEVGKLKELVQGQVGSLKQVRRVWTDLNNNQVRSYSGNMRRIQNQVIAVRRAQENLKKPIEDANKSVKTMNLSWQSMIRLVGLQLARQAISALTRAIAEGVRQAIELEKRIAEVRTISQEAQLPFNEWRDSLVELSNAFGIPVLDQVEAAYQTLSNQVAEGAETFAFLDEANRLALASVSSTSEAVNLLTASINAFELDISQTEKIAAQFFKTVELGRVRISEMATTLGDVGVLAHQLNIPLTDLQALIATLTINGIAYNKANTQLRGIFVKLLKPTSDMKKLFEELGVASGEEAIRIFGLNGFLQKLIEVTKGSSTEIAKYISRIRGLSGILAIVNKDQEKFVYNQEQIKNATASYVAAQALVLESSGKKLEIELNKIKNFFLVELGDSILQFVSKSSDGFDGLTTVVKSFAESILLVLIPVLTILIYKLLILSFSNPFSGAIAGAVILIGYLRLIHNRAIIFAEAEREAYEASWTSRVKAAEKASKQITDDFKESLNEQLLAVERFAAKTFGDFAKSRRATIKDTKDFAKDLAVISKSMTKELTSGISAAKKEFREFSKLAEQLRQDTIDSFRDTGGYLFEIQIEDKDYVSKIKDIETRMARLKEAQLFAVSFGDKKAFDQISAELISLEKLRYGLEREALQANKDNAEERIKLQDTEAKANQKLARKKLDLQLRWNAEWAKEKPNADRLRKIKIQYNRLLEDHAKKIGKIQEAEKKIIDSQIQQRDHIKEITELTAKQGKLALIWAEDLERQAEKARQKVLSFTYKKIELEGALREFQKFNLKEALKIDDPKAAAKALEARRDETRRLFTILKEIGVSEKDQARLLIRNANEELALNQRIAALKKDAAIEQLKLQRIAIEESFKALQERQQTEITGLIKFDKSYQEVLRQLQRSIAGEQAGIFRAPGVEAGARGSLADILVQAKALESILPGIKGSLEIFKEMPSVGGFDVIIGEVRRLQAMITTDVDLGPFGISTKMLKQRDAARKSINELIIALLKQKKAQETEEDIRKRIKQQDQWLRVQKKIIDVYKQSQKGMLGFDEDTDKSIKKTKLFKDEILGLTDSVYDFVWALNVVKESVRTLKFPTPVGAEFFAQQELAKGGQPHGHDTVPAMLSPGEFVVNAAASRRFYSQLVRMNSGVQHFDRGGQVSNVNVGDINVNLPSTTSPDYDAVRLGKVLRRGIRRGTIAL